MKSELRDPNAEGTPNAECRTVKDISQLGSWKLRAFFLSALGFRISDFFRISALGLRISFGRISDFFAPPDLLNLPVAAHG
jgi:hypothetical protein